MILIIRAGCSAYSRYTLGVLLRYTLGYTPRITPGGRVHRATDPRDDFLMYQEQRYSQKVFEEGWNWIKFLSKWVDPQNPPGYASTQEYNSFNIVNLWSYLVSSTYPVLAKKLLNQKLKLYGFKRSKNLSFPEK